MKKRLFVLLLVLVAGLVSCRDTSAKFKPLEEATIVVAIGSSHDQYITTNYPTANILRVQSMAEVANIIDKQRADYGVLDAPVALDLSSTNSDIKIVDTLFMTKIAAGFNKSNATLQQEFNHFLEDFIPSDTFKEINERWSVAEISDLPQIELPKQGKKITIGVCSSNPPFCVIKDNELTGMDIEIMRHFALHSGYTLDFRDMNYDALLNSLSTNRIDILISGLTYTDERAKSILFSDSYLKVPSMLITNLEGKKSESEIAQNTTPTYSKETLGDYKVVVAVGTTHDLFMAKNYPDADIQRVDNIADVANMVENDKADFGILDRANYDLLTSKEKPLQVVDGNIFSTNIGAVFNKDRAALRDEFNDFLKEFMTSDTFKDMNQRWHIEGDGGVIPTIEIPATGRILNIGCLSDAPPAGTIINNKLEGFDVELVKHFAATKGYELNIVTYNFAGMLSSIIAGKSDMAACEISITEERQKSMLFSDPYHRVESCIFRKNATSTPEYVDFVMPPVIAKDGIATKKDSIRTVIEGKRVGVIEGTVHDQYILKNFPNAQVQTYKDFADLSQSVMAGKSEFMLYNHVGIKTLKKEQPSLEILFKDFEREQISFGVNKNNKQLLNELNSFMSECNEDGGIEKIVKKWLTQLGDGRIEGAELSGDCDKTITVGTAGISIPFTFVADGKFEGMDIEIITLFCKDRGYNLEIVQMPFGSLIAALTTGKIDIIANCFLSTEERKEKINFSTPYSTHGFALATNRKQVSNHTERKGFIEGFKSSFENNIIKEDRYKLLLDGLKVTTVISLFSILLGTILGIIVCYMKMSSSRILSTFANGYITIIRGTPVLVLLMINFYVVFAKTSLSAEFVAVISFAMNFAAYVSEMFRSSILSIDKGQTEAGLAMGFTKIKTFIFIVAPQAIKQVLPIFKGESISLVKMTSVVGYIAVQDITKVGDIIRSRTFDAFFPLLVSALLYFLLAYLFTKLLDLLTINKNR